MSAGGDAATLSRDFAVLTDRAADMGLQLNIGKCEIVYAENDSIPPIFGGFKRVLPSECELLGALFLGVRRWTLRWLPGAQI